MVRKKTTSEKEVINALNVMFLGDLGKGMTAMCKQAVENYNDDV